ALRHLDLEIVGVDEIFARDAETRRRHLLDCAPPRITVRIENVPPWILATLTAVRLATEALHRYRPRFMPFPADRAVGHRSGREPLENRLGRLDLLDRHRRSYRLEAEQTTERRAIHVLLIDRARVLLENRVLPAARRVLQLEDRVGIEQVVLTVP